MGTYQPVHLLGHVYFGVLGMANIFSTLLNKLFNIATGLVTGVEYYVHNVLQRWDALVHILTRDNHFSSSKTRQQVTRQKRMIE